MKILLCFIFVFCCLMGHTQTIRDFSPILQIDWDILRAIPIQDQGRIKPLDSFARVLLCQMSGKTSLTLPNGTRLSAIEWLFQSLFLPQEAVHYPIFLVENATILDLMGLSTERMRARYSYAELVDGLHNLRHYCWRLSLKSQEHYTFIDRQALALATNTQILEDIFRAFEFWEAYPAQNLELAKQVQEEYSTQEYVDYLSFREKITTRIKESSSTLGIPSNASSNNSDVATTTQESPENEDWKKPPLSIAKIWTYTQSLPPQEQEKLCDLIRTEISLRCAHIPDKKFSIFPDYPIWFSPYESLAQDLENQKHMLMLWSKICRAYQAGDAQLLQRLILQHQDMMRVQIGGLPEYAKIPWEVQYNSHDVFFLSKIIFLLAMLICAMSWWKTAETKFYITSMLCIVLGFFLQSYGLLLRMLIKGRPPVSNLYETMIFVSWFTVGMGLFLEIIFFKKLRSISVFMSSLLATFLLFLSEKFAYENDTMGVLIAVLDSNFWLATHVTTIIIGYSATLLAGTIGHILIVAYLLQKYITSPLDTFSKHMESMMYGTIVFGTIFTFLGTVLGGFWADQSWGRFWGWDPKENGALVLLLWNAVLLHARAGGYLGSQGLALGSIFGNIIVGGAWWGVNLLNIGLHSYGFNDGIRSRLLFFVIFELGIIVIGWKVFSCISKKEKIL